MRRVSPGSEAGAAGGLGAMESVIVSPRAWTLPGASNRYAQGALLGPDRYTAQFGKAGFWPFCRLSLIMDEVRV